MKLNKVAENIYNDICLATGLAFFIMYIAIILVLMYPYYKYNAWDIKTALGDLLS